MTTFDLAGVFELTIDPTKPFQFIVKLLSENANEYSGIIVERRYKSSDTDPSHPARKSIPVVTITNLEDNGDNNDNENRNEAWKKGKLITVNRAGLYYCEAQQYDSDEPSVDETGEVTYLAPSHPVVVNGYSLLDASENGDFDELLEEENVNPNYIFNFWSPLHHAVQNGFPEIVEILAKHGADVDDIQNWIWITPLQMVGDNTQSKFDLKMVKLLVSLGADPTNTNANLAKSIVEYAATDNHVKQAIEEGLQLRKAKIPSLQDLTKDVVRKSDAINDLDKQFPHLQIKDDK